jgi:hypothetical protein
MLGRVGRVAKFPPFYNEYRSQGRHYGYVRVGRPPGGTRIRITHPLGTPGFQPAYEAAIDALGLRDKVNRRNRIVVDDHNAARWLAVAWVDAPPDHRHPPDRFDPGWHVVRVCPCHRDVPVTIVRATRADAERAMAAMLKVAS